MKNEISIQDELKLALLQFEPVWENAEANCVYLQELLEELDSDTDVVILPEAFSTGFSMQAQNISESMNGNTLQWMKYIASKLDVVLCGSLFVAENHKFFNRFVWVQANGTIETYDKRHLFSLGNEDKHYQRGERPTIIDYKGWKIFPQICYDIRFPVWSRNTFAYDLLINVANWPAPRFEVWNTLLKARAIENQCYVAAVNRLGEDGKSISYRGDSMVIDAKGKVTTNVANKLGIHYSTLSKSGLIFFRNKFNTLSDADRFSIEP